MQLLIAVAEDLFSFALTSLSRLFVRSGDVHHKVIYLERPERGLVSAPARPLSVPQSIAMPAPAHTEATRSPRKNTVMYAATIDVPLYQVPHSTSQPDAFLPYGTMLMVLGSEDGWSRVIAGSREGWVRTDDLADRAAHVYPQFVIGEGNDADDPNTIRLRAMIGDAFAAGAAELPLQSEEYVLYKLYRRGVRVDMPKALSYEAGRWSLVLRDLQNAAIAQEPKAGAIMQIPMPEGAAAEHFAYVDAVFPDGTLQISEANWPEEGIYNERVLVKEEWHTLNPVFFTIA